MPEFCLCLSVCPFLSHVHGEAVTKLPVASLWGSNPPILHTYPSPPVPLPSAPLTSRGKHAGEQRRQPRGGGAGMALSRASSLCLAAKRNANPKENWVYSHVLLRKVGVSQPPPNLPVMLLPRCEAVTVSDSTYRPSSWEVRVSVLVCVCLSSISKAHAIHRNNIFLLICMIFFLFAFMGFTEMKN